jgi:glycosyltransferase involved in cell wall biosynthesis
MSSENELVSIIIPVHNKKKTEICVKHIKRQTYRNIELILVDFPGFPAEKRNYGYGKSHGSLILFLDEDEYMMPPTISVCVNKFKEGFDIVGIPQIKLKQKSYLEKCISILRENVAKPLFFKREVLEKIGLFRPEYVLCDDVDILIRAFSAGYKYDMMDIKEGYILHDEINTLTSVFQKTVLSRKAYKKLRKKYSLNFDLMTRKHTQRKRIIRELIARPALIPGALLAMLTLFMVRRIP